MQGRDCPDSVPGQATPLLYSLPASAIDDVQPVGSSSNLSGSITDSAFCNSPFSTRWFVLTFGTDTSLTTGSGWDNVTGVGTPNGANFVNAVG